MPIVRFSRDKRGLDTLYLIDTRAESGRWTNGARVLYFWTAPPGLRVGREALDDSRQRALERAHPEIEFDWPALLKAVDAARTQAAVLTPEARREAWRGAGRAGRTAPRPVSREEPPPRQAVPTPKPPPRVPTLPREVPIVDDSAPAATAVPSSESDDAATRRPRRRRRRPRRPGQVDEAPASADPIIES